MDDNILIQKTAKTMDTAPLFRLHLEIIISNCNIYILFKKKRGVFEKNHVDDI
jgi:hypothetical protein